MGESKYFEKLNKLIEDIINCTSKNFPSLKNDAKRCFDDIYNYLINNNNNFNNESNQNYCENNYSNYFIRYLRIKYQIEINKNISNENIIISKGKIICELIFWLIKETKMFSFQQILKFLQDIIETIPFSGIEQIFNLVSEFVKSSQYYSLNKEEGKLDILFLQNIFLKRIDNNLDNELRGKVLLLFCDFFSIEEKSGINKNGKYSNNQMNEELSNYSNDNSDTVINDEEPKIEIEENIEKKIILLDKDIINIKDSNNMKEDKIEKNKMIIEEEIKTNENNNIKDIKDNKMKEEKNNYKKDINIGKEQNEKILFYEQFWKIEKILINPFMVCKLFYNLYNNKLFYFIAI